MVSDAWVKFNKTHHDSTETIEVDGVKKLHWKCSCGAENIFPANSGWVVGSKVNWRNHFESLKREGKI
ncbi:hypothetical protein DLE04_00405 [Actinobacteria bacterium IMCC26103]|nr:hypothetical protein DLE04_00405 [Actinobacteria bacterium IMCC26103]